MATGNLIETGLAAAENRSSAWGRDCDGDARGADAEESERRI